MSKSALIVVDVQNDFVEDGELAVEGGRDLAKRIAEYLKLAKSDEAYDLYVCTQDWHIDPGSHFDIWPEHCVANTDGAKLCAPLTNDMFDYTIFKGQYDDGYSGFASTSLEEILRGNDISVIDVIGIAGDYCVKATAIDGAKCDFDVTVVRDLVVNINELPVEDLAEYGVEIH